MGQNKKAVLVDITLQVRVIVDEDMDMEGREFDKIVTNDILLLANTKSNFIADGIQDYNDDTVNPFNDRNDG